MTFGVDICPITPCWSTLTLSWSCQYHTSWSSLKVKVTEWNCCWSGECTLSTEGFLIAFCGLKMPLFAVDIAVGLAHVIAVNENIIIQRLHWFLQENALFTSNISGRLPATCCYHLAEIRSYISQFGRCGPDVWNNLPPLITHWLSSRQALKTSFQHCF